MDSDLSDFDMTYSEKFKLRQYDKGIEIIFCWLHMFQNTFYISHYYTENMNLTLLTIS